MATKWQSFKQKWEGCTRCPLSERRDKVVLARGKIPAPVLFIGEAPGKSENVLGKPFIGQAGKLLDEIIRLSIDSQYDYALTNIVSCIPYEYEDYTITREPEKEEIDACRERLGEFVNLVQPKVVILVGALAKKSIPGQATFGGRYDTGGKGNWIRFAEITHPAAILRMNIAARPLEIKRAVATINEALDSIEEES